MKTFNITIKEVDNPNLLHPSYTGDVDRKFIIEFFGLNEPDVEWYELNLIED